MTQNIQLITSSSEETFALGKKIAAGIQPGTVLALHGDLGSGKTTFTQGLAIGLGILQQVTSPTFLIMKRYQIEGNPKISTLYHIDLYRLSENTKSEELGINEALQDPQGITVIEWPEKIQIELPESTVQYTFSYVDDTVRQIEREIHG